MDDATTPNQEASMAAYTHTVHFIKRTRYAGSVACSFRTTADAVELSLRGLRANPNVDADSVRAEPLR